MAVIDVMASTQVIHMLKGTLHSFKTGTKWYLPNVIQFNSYVFNFNVSTGTFCLHCILNSKVSKHKQ